jgi:hypothetical protein
MVDMTICLPFGIQTHGRPASQPVEYPLGAEDRHTPWSLVARTLFKECPPAPRLSESKITSRTELQTFGFGVVLSMDVTVKFRSP